MKKGLKWFDEKLIKAINENIKSDFLDRFMPKITNIGGVVFTTLFILALLIFGKGKARTIGIQGSVTLAISQSITYGLKSLLSRERPYNMLKNLNTFGIILKDYSFPSGHTSASFSVATTIVLNIPKLTFVVFAIALLIGVSRIYLGVHYPTDVVAGIILGVGSAIVVHMYLINYIKNLINIFQI
ncbi:phosphatase PAP2 family protein [Clostridium sp. Cult2]|uniref:phosphatase PAP2 family protein n=1 Tax=Clostridium sp. Cult2 TaxID=2079003 RepID=UPI001F2F0F7D|nr:phosphatase PAP2 family protein [Clostridium sp. Cult2]MCF6464795.1 phosphatase PAP2 family protein [Clostridium sp. Cult2]